jgi:hypothetical protein
MDPVRKLVPIIKLIGRFIVSVKKKLMLFFFELFCIPISKIKNKVVLKISANNIL